MAATVASNLGEAEFRDGNAQAALCLAGEALAANQARNDTLRVAFGVFNIVAYVVALERYDEARARARDGIALCRDAQSEVHLVFMLQHLAAVAAFTSAPDCRAPSRRCARK